jgi:uncharacterized protein with PIN domain
MSHLLSECPNCGRAFLGGVSRAGKSEARCRVCGTPLVQAAGEKETEVHDRLYGRQRPLARVAPGSRGEEPAS